MCVLQLESPLLAIFLRELSVKDKDLHKVKHNYVEHHSEKLKTSYASNNRKLINLWLSLTIEWVTALRFKNFLSDRRNVHDMVLN